MDYIGPDYPYNYWTKSCTMSMVLMTWGKSVA
jgi:hypothetical protein